MNVELYRGDGPASRSVRVGIRNDGLVLDTRDTGRVTEEVWGDSDYEFWTRVDRADWGPLLVALMKEFFADDPKATDRLRDLCEKHGVPHDRESRV